jgi:hypothetical protein
MAISCRCPRELRAAVGARRLRRLARLLALVPQEVAESRELPSVAPMLPALWLGSALYHSDVPTLVTATACHNRRDLVHQALVLHGRLPAAHVVSRVSFVAFLGISDAYPY